MPTRRIFCLGAGATFAGASLVAGSRSAEAADPIPPFPLRLVVAQRDGKPVVSDAWLDEQVSEAQRLMKPHGVTVQAVSRASFPEAKARLEDADDRDALHALLEPRVINVFVVISLRDIDDPKRMRMGVRWRLRRDLRKDYVIVSSRAIPMVLCHELGHFFGNGHSGVVNNIMSYKRDDPAKVAFNARQGRRMRQVARRLLRTGKVLSVEELERRKREQEKG